MDDASIIARLRAAKPDIVLVCFGCPKQEKWIFRHYRSVGAPVMIGAGGTVDFLAGRLSRAPMWMRRTGTEWVFRLLQEPRRLFARYAGDLLGFVPALLAQRWRLPARLGRTGVPRDTPSSAQMYYGIKVLAAERLQRNFLESGSAFWAHVMEQQGHCLIDLAGVKSIDSTGLAFLSHWQRRLAQGRRNLILFQPSESVRSALEHMRLTEQFIITDGSTPDPSPPSASAGQSAMAAPGDGP
jgi:N-acetylglucosaminyldiphosphoundecaprenol N-acetyl-beta-D-mannosaminyltransferase